MNGFVFQDSKYQLHPTVTLNKYKDLIIYQPLTQSVVWLFKPKEL